MIFLAVLILICMAIVFGVRNTAGIVLIACVLAVMVVLWALGAR